MPKANPYQPNDSRYEKNAPPFRLRMIPAVLLGLIGLAFLAWGLLALIVVIAIAPRDYEASSSISQQISPIWLMVAATTIFIGVGCATMMSGWQVWKQRYRRAMAYIGGVFVLLAGAATMNMFWG